MPECFDDAALRDRLEELASATEAASRHSNGDPVAGVAARARRRRRERQTRHALVAATAAIALVFAAWRMASADDEPTTRLDITNPTTVPSPTTSTGSTPSIPPSPTTLVPTPSTPGTVAGVSNLDPGPLAIRQEALVLETGDTVLVWGGNIIGVPSGANEMFADGAMYDTTTRRWRSTSASPLPTESGNQLGVWTGTEAVVFRSGEAAAYNPATDRWRTLAKPSTRPTQVVRVGSTLVALGPDAVYDTARDRWQPFDKPAEYGDFQTHATPELVSIGTHAVVASVTYGGPKVVTAWAVDPATATLTKLPQTTLTDRDNIIQAASSGDGRLIVIGRAMGVAQIDVPRALVNRSTTWQKLPSVPLRSYEGSPGWVTAHDTTIYVEDGSELAWFDGASWRITQAPTMSVPPSETSTYRFGLDHELGANRFLRIDLDQYVAPRN